MKKTVIFCIIGFVADRLTKAFALTQIAAPIHIASYFYIYPVTNTGVAWGLFRNLPSTFVTGWTLALATVLAVYTAQQYFKKRPYFCEALILTGAFSNILDRMLWSGVLDFIIFTTGNWTFPAFNIADALIFIGVTTRVLSNLFITRKNFRAS